MPLLARHLLDQLGFPHVRLSADALALLSRYSWPGNVRELKNVLLRAAHGVTESTLTPAHFPQEISALAAESASVPVGALKETEMTLIRRALAEADGNLARAAACLGIHRVTLYRKMKRYSLPGVRPREAGMRQHDASA
jgi:DNA-binding NtrC family response regulator